MTSSIKPSLTILICTHNRAELLGRVLASLNAAARPANWQISILVGANNCNDDTVASLQRYQEDAEHSGWLPLAWFEEPLPGKSHALNHAIRLLSDDAVALVDDDHRVDHDYLVHICRALTNHPEATMFCGRILPDWDGSEPEWVHDAGPYRIYPLPVPRYDQGMTARLVTEAHGPLPGGGNLFLRTPVFARVGGFSTDLGPRGHDLGGGEDSEFVLTALQKSEHLQYIPEVLQHHFVDTERLKFSYLIRKSYQRSRSVARVHHQDQHVPRYIWRKLVEHAAHTVFSLSWPKTRFYLMRSASTLGELQGMREKIRQLAPSRNPLPVDHARPASWVALAAAGMITVGIAISFFPASLLRQVAEGALAAGCGALLLTTLIGAKSLRDFSQTGPQIQSEIRHHYRWYTLAAFARLTGWALLLLILMGALGATIYAALSAATGLVYTSTGAFIAAFLGVALITSWQFCRHLLYLPASLVSSMHYRMSRLYPLWRNLTPTRLRLFGWGLGVLTLALFLFASLRLIELDKVAPLAALWGSLAALVGLVGWANAATEPVPVKSQRTDSRPNILMLGSDTLRADRLGIADYRRQLTPRLDKLGVSGAQFTQCYVPCARTAPSLISLFSGTWPHRHGIRDNFVADSETHLPVPCLPQLLANAGYATVAVSDWCGADLGKFSLGFQQVDAPDDQWNIKYLIRQGPKDLRLFLSLFSHNRFGKRFLPELYYLAGVPLTPQVGRDARAHLSRLAVADQPFLLNVFLSATHPPFGSEYPYYSLYADPTYAGESKFVMARLTDPQEIIRRQGDGRKEFDLDQILDLYDGCVKSFDDEAGRILNHLAACGLADNTIVVVYSDHGMEFFEHETWGQGNSAVGDFSARIPLIIRDPRVTASVVERQIVRSVDIAPTLLELVGLAVPQAMEGVSLASAVRGENMDLGLPAFNETGIWITDLPGMPEGHLRYPNLLELLEVPDKASGTLAIKPQYRDIVFEAKDRMIRVGRWKLVYQPVQNGALYQLFDLETDPACQHNRLADKPELAEVLKQKLLAWVADDPACSHSRAHLTAS
ncbi:MAG: sulfatase-like hydrolase/transferase [Pseudomonadota bacterium]